MRKDLKIINPCPFCGKKFFIDIRDDEGNLRNKEYEHDPWSGLSFSVRHTKDKNKNCPIAHHEDEQIGTILFESRNELIEVMNKRILK